MKQRVRIQEGSVWAKLAARKLGSTSCAIVLGHTIHIYGVSRADFTANKKWFRHELKHVEQYERDGYLPFLLKYAAWSAKYGYANNPYEKEAREAEDDESILSRFDIIL